MAERDAAAAAALADRDAATVTKLERLMRTLSESVDIKIKNLTDTVDEEMVSLEQRVQERWNTFEDKWSEKVVHPDDKEAVICDAEFRTRRAVQQDEDERWKKRMANEDKITIETLRSDLNKMSAKMADEVVSLKNRQQSSAASTVSVSTESGGSGSHFASSTEQLTFVASRVELKGWGSWRNIRGTGITMDEAKQLVNKTMARLKQDDLNMFDWELTDSDWGMF